MTAHMTHQVSHLRHVTISYRYKVSHWKSRALTAGIMLCEYMPASHKNSRHWITCAHLCRSCRRAEGWTPRGSCSAPLWLCLYMFCHSRRCSQHTSLPERKTRKQTTCQHVTNVYLLQDYRQGMRRGLKQNHAVISQTTAEQDVAPQCFRYMR